MKLVDLDGVMFVPVVDETHGGAVVEMKMTVGEFFGKFCQGFEPKTIDAIPVEWLIDRANDPERAPLYRRYAQMLYEEWQKEQEVQDG
jgi:hypothetical protein